MFSPDNQQQDRVSKRQAKFDRSSLKQRTISAPYFELAEIKGRQIHWAQTQTTRPGATAERSKYLSNKTHYSPTDPDADGSFQILLLSSLVRLEICLT
jgi:hypothetical protein